MFHAFSTNHTRGELQRRRGPFQLFTNTKESSRGLIRLGRVDADPFYFQHGRLIDGYGYHAGRPEIGWPGSIIVHFEEIHSEGRSWGKAAISEFLQFERLVGIKRGGGAERERRVVTLWGKWAKICILGLINIWCFDLTACDAAFFPTG